MGNILNKNKKAFTLAEVLITLSIIGVIAAISIPSLMSSTQNKENNTAYKKLFAELSQAFNKIKQENGGTMMGVCENPSTTAAICLKDELAKHLNVSKNCDSSFGVCWHLNNVMKRHDGEFLTWNHEGGSAIVLNNGAMIYSYVQSPTCDLTAHAPADSKICATVHIDVNGFKGPNKFGKDLFWLHFSEKYGTLPGSGEHLYGSPDDCDVPTSTGGCGARILMGLY